jgi:sugar O-acyltransferase (sialic acid O-acetyltransferase NeuD family)
MKKQLLIIGAGGFGREVLEYAKDIAKVTDVEWEIGGFLDDDLNVLDNYSYEHKVIGTIKDHKISDKYVYFCAIGAPKTKLSIGRAFLEKGANFINMIHPSAYVASSCKMGSKVILCPDAKATTDVTLGNFVAVDVSSVCSHDSVIGDGCTISHFCDLTGFSTLGEGVFLGSGVSVCPGVKVGDYATIGAGSVVLHDVGNNELAFGTPAKSR